MGRENIPFYRVQEWTPNPCLLENNSAHFLLVALRLYVCEVRYFFAMDIKPPLCQMHVNVEYLPLNIVVRSLLWLTQCINLRHCITNFPDRCSLRGWKAIALMHRNGHAPWLSSFRRPMKYKLSLFTFNTYGYALILPTSHLMGQLAINSYEYVRSWKQTHCAMTAHEGRSVRKHRCDHE